MTALFPRHRVAPTPAVRQLGERPSSRPVIALERVSKTYGSGEAAVRAVSGVDLVVERGDYLAIMGASGSGKSTLMNIIGCLDTPTQGRYRLDGVDVRLLDEHQLAVIRNRKIGFIFQNFNLIPRTKALENVALPLSYMKVRAAERQERAMAALEAVGLADRAHHRPNELSGGQQQRVAVARAIVTEPVLLLADEPTGALDSHASEEVLALFDQLNAAGRTVVVITHEAEVARHAHRVIRMRDGQIIEDVRFGMNLIGPLRFAVRGINANRMRSLLTTLGILIGVASVIVLLAVGTGSSAAVKKSIARLGTDTLTVSRSANGNGRAGGTGGGGFAGGPGGGGGFGGGAGAGGAAAANSGSRTQSTNLTLDDANALLSKSAAPDVGDIAPVVTASSVTAGYTGVTHTVGSFVGSTPSYLTINNDVVQYGSSFSDSDYTDRADVAVIGTTVADDLFGSASSAVGQTVQFNGKNYIVRGVLKSKGTTGSNDQDDIVIAPLTSVEDEFTGVGQSLSSIAVQATGSGTVTKAQNEIYTVLDSRHNVTSTTRDFTVQNPSSIVATATSSTRTLTILLGAVAAISLLVGGIGVMNIMLVTVTERTREIGIRKAIGAGKADIVIQFIAEAMLLSAIGAALGVVVGLIGSQFTIVGVEPVVATWSVFLAFGVAVATGLFLRYLPSQSSGQPEADRRASLRVRTHD